MSATTKLTKRASLKFANLCDSAEEAHARVLANQRRINAAEDQRRLLSEQDTEAFRELTAEIQRISQRRDHDNSDFLHLTRVVTAIRTWLLQVPADARFSDAAPPKPEDVRNSEAAEQGVERCREEIERLRNERGLLARAVPPLADLHAAAALHVERLAARGRPSVAISGGQIVVRHGHDKGFSPGAGHDQVALAAWLHAEVMVERLRQQIDALHESDVRRGVPVMTPAERDARLADTDERILKLERLEEFYVEVGEQYNMHIPRRDDANPLAILGVSMHRRERAAA